jgi:hypothetical protein
MIAATVDRRRPAKVDAMDFEAEQHHGLATHPDALRAPVDPRREWRDK